MAGRIKLSTQFHEGPIHKRHNWEKGNDFVRREKLLEIVSAVPSYYNE